MCYWANLKDYILEQLMGCLSDPLCAFNIPYSAFVCSLECSSSHEQRSVNTYGCIGPKEVIHFDDG